jgi:hypothetical protein
MATPRRKQTFNLAQYRRLKLTFTNEHGDVVATLEYDRFSDERNMEIAGTNPQTDKLFYVLCDVTLPEVRPRRLKSKDLTIAFDGSSCPAYRCKILDAGGDGELLRLETDGSRHSMESLGVNVYYGQSDALYSVNIYAKRAKAKGGAK